MASAFLVGDTLKDLKILFKAKAYRTAPAHYGGKIAFLSDGTLIITSGDGYNNKEDAQFLDNHFEKIIRINPDGSVPAITHLLIKTTLYLKYILMDIEICRVLSSVMM